MPSRSTLSFLLLAAFATIAVAQTVPYCQELKANQDTNKITALNKAIDEATTGKQIRSARSFFQKELDLLNRGLKFDTTIEIDTKLKSLRFENGRYLTFLKDAQVKVTAVFKDGSKDETRYFAITSIPPIAKSANADKGLRVADWTFETNEQRFKLKRFAYAIQLKSGQVLSGITADED